MAVQEHAIRSRPLGNVARAIARILAAVAGATVLAQVSWNMFAPELFGAKALTMRESLGLVLFAAVVAGGLRLAAGRCCRE